jgi:hypothetical protein
MEFTDNVRTRLILRGLVSRGVISEYERVLLFDALPIPGDSPAPDGPYPEPDPVED